MVCVVVELRGDVLIAAEMIEKLGVAIDWRRGWTGWSHVVADNSCGAVVMQDLFTANIQSGRERGRLGHIRPVPEAD